MHLRNSACLGEHLYPMRRSTSKVLIFFYFGILELPKNQSTIRELIPSPANHFALLWLQRVWVPAFARMTTGRVNGRWYYISTAFLLFKVDSQKTFYVCICMFTFYDMRTSNHLYNSYVLIMLFYFIHHFFFIINKNCFSPTCLFLYLRK